ncbi:MAG: nucleotidyl transferase AbiEii/AbiGii toxin family protein [bacterium]
MGQDLLTKEQKQILEFVSKDKVITSQFYLTGGTALSYFYFKHRFSEDLDFFSEDVAINKVHAITSRKRGRDYLDLYLCMKKLDWNPSDLRKNYRLKFEIDLPIEQLATSFVNVLDAEDRPIFLGKQDFGRVKEFFLKEADKLKGDILK